MSGYTKMIDPKKVCKEHIQGTFETRYDTEKVTYFGMDFGHHFGVWSKRETSVSCGLLDEVQASNWKIIQAGTRDGCGYIEVQEVDNE